MAYQNTTELLWIERFFKFVLWILLTTSMVMSVYYGEKFIAEKTIIEQRIADTYKLPLESANNLQCYQGYLHYPNQGTFSGLLAITPNISCNEQEFSELSANQFSAWFITYIVLTLMTIGLLRIIKS